jgi:hypothetical protein
MFPTWSDWDIKYTTKGIFKKHAINSVKILALAMTIVTAIRLRKHPLEVKSHIKHAVRSALFSGINILQMAEKKIS